LARCMPRPLSGLSCGRFSSVAVLLGIEGQPRFQIRDSGAALSDVHTFAKSDRRTLWPQSCPTHAPLAHIECFAHDNRIATIRVLRQAPVRPADAATEQRGISSMLSAASKLLPMTMYRAEVP
jgi:hypothetical protein